MDYLKNYILWPLIAVLLTAIIYLSLVLSVYQALIAFPQAEELVWQLLSEKTNPASSNFKAHRMEILLNNKVTLLVKEDPYINAYAAPGNRIILTTGLLNNIKSENALLFVIGHEMAHLERKDHLKEFTRNLISSSFGIITRSILLPEILMQIDTTKYQEIEFIADQYSLEKIIKFYQHAGGIDELFQILLQQDNDKPLKYTISSHPEIRLRYRKVNELIENGFIRKENVIEF